MRFLFLIIAISVIVPVSLFASETLNDPEFRADNYGIWHIRDNPAGPGLSPDIFDTGVLYAPGEWDIAAQCPFLNYSYNYTYNDALQRVGISLGFDKGFSFGYDYQWWQQQTYADFSSIGLLIRPYDFLSVGLTCDISNSSSFGFGIGIRPLSFIQGIGSALTITADAHTESNSFVFESIGCRIALNDSISLRSWYDFQNSMAGLELTFTIGPFETRVAAPYLPDISDFRAGESIRIAKSASSSQGIDLSGSKILVINNIDEIYPTPQTNSLLRTIFFDKNTIDLPSLLNMIRRAGKDPGIVAIAFENLPSVGIYAAAQELANALGEFRRTGKKVYFYADEYYFSGQYQILASQADLIFLNPSGSVNLTGIGFKRLYFRDFLDKLGIRCVNLAPWETKSANNPFTYNEMPAGERDMTKRYLKDISDQELMSFSEGRAGRLKDSPLEAIETGPYLASGKALDAGIVDAVMYEDDFEDCIVKSNEGAHIITKYTVPEDTTWGPPSAAKKVAVLYLNGPIILGFGNAGTSIGTSAVEEIRQLRNNQGISAILIRINSPGGVVITSDAIGREVKKTVSAGKTVVVSMGDVAASGGYYASCFASKIFAEPGTLTGSIGVTGLLVNFSGTLGKLGIHSDRVDLYKSSGFLDPSREFKESDISNVHDMIISMYDRFVSDVSEGRRLSDTRVRELGEGRIWTGREALTNGLIDKLGSLEDSKNYLREKLGGWVEFNDYIVGNFNFAEDLLGDLTKATLSSISGADTENISTSLKPYIRAASELLSIGSGPVLYYDWMGAGE